ncbi:MAG: DUF2961 domain-containing protein [Sedimentisphaerales bacterium]|nr:DUF2961 domain-containing protein [Sedimentisphaerales bacterium]
MMLQKWIPLFVVLFSISIQPVSVALEDLATVTSATTQRASSYDTTGGNKDAVNNIMPGHTIVLLDTDGSGCIRHIWITVSEFYRHRTWSRDLVIRMFWDNAEVPSVEVPLGDFFALGHGRQYRVNSAPVCVGDNSKAMNCYWPMPFHRHARVEITNSGQRSVRKIYWNIDYELGPVADNQGLFHALYRRDKALPGQDASGPEVQDNYVILETTGRGQYVGCVLNVDSAPGGWWGEGDEVIFIDQRDKPNIFGTGSEDYFCNAWGFHRTFTYPNYGVPLMEKLEDGHTLTTAYRWHVNDAYRFQNYIKVTLEHIYPTNITNDYSSVAFWYQDKPIAQRPPLPAGADNPPRYNPPQENATDEYRIDGTELEPILRNLGIDVQTQVANARAFARGWLLLSNIADGVAIPVPVAEAGEYQLQVRPWFPDGTRQFRIGLARDQLQTLTASSPDHSPAVVNLGKVTAQGHTVMMYIQADTPAGVDYITVKKLADKPK